MRTRRVLSAMVVALMAAAGFAVSGTAATAIAAHNGTLHFGGSVRELPRREDPVAMSCPKPGDCVGADAEANVFMERAGVWAAPRRLPGEQVASSVSCAGTTSCLALGTPHDFRWNGHHWSRIAHSPTADAVSCITSTRCLAVSNSTNQASWWRGKRWSKPFRTTHNAALQPFRVVCPAAKRCLVSYANGAVSTWNGHHWSKAHHVLVDLYDLACGGPRSCLATSSGNRSRSWNGRSWGPSETISPSGFVQVHGLSCPTPGVCAGVGNGGLMTYRAGHWVGPSPVGTDASVQVVECVTVSRCTAVAYDGTLLTGTATALSVTGDVDPMTAATSMSCASATACVVVDDTGHARVWNGSTWTPRTTVDRDGLNAVSCPTTTRCTAVDNIGRVVVKSGGDWSKPVMVDPHYDGGQPDQLSCAEPGYCALVSSGFVVMERAGVWQAPLHLDPSQLLSVSCPGRDFCGATDFEGRVYTYDGVNWSPGDEIDSGADQAFGLSHISCSGPTNCVAEATGTHASHDVTHITSWLLRYDGHTWTRIPHAHFFAGGGGLSCATSRRCVTTEGDVIDHDGRIHAVDIPKGFEITQTEISCPTYGFCAALDVDSGVSFGRD